ncbi:hypothetical protein [Salinibacter ruber]|uniref:Uncharacterized protein n=1 Tax=Salinibacter ruber TaxID=146919 RepID=A0A9X2Q7D0_9BACT|nr:hypothetical protein [Salinibacter ruber]MCS3661775.1 hypothetical protein [Salinibacter ruber]MCS3711564.1 hypothetical protein [Salinibacter ruber]
MATSEATSSLGTLEKAAARRTNHAVKLTTTYMRDWPSIITDVVNALNFRAGSHDLGDPIDPPVVEILESGDVRITFSCDRHAMRFMNFIDSIN